MKKKGGALMKTESQKKIRVGIGTSQDKDHYDAAKKAAQMAIKECGGKPTFSLVYVDSRYDPKKVLKGINEVLGTQWVGCSVDTLLNTGAGFMDSGISVVCIASDYLHFSAAVAENYRNNPTKAGEEGIRAATKKVNVDQYVDPYVQFRRAQTKSYIDIVRTPPYFIMMFTSGAEYVKGKPIPGMETEFLEGIFNVTGPNIPVVGAAASVNFDNYMKGKGENFEFANGRLYHHAGVVIFVVSSLYFSYSLWHGYKKSDQIGLITKMDKTGHIIEEINGKPAVDEYARMLGITKQELLKNPFKYTLPRPLGVLNTYGDIFIKEAVPNPDGKTMYCLTKVAIDSAVTLVNYSEQATIDAVKNCINDAHQGNQEKEIGLGLVFSCSGRKALLGKKVTKELESAKRTFKDAPLIGFHSFSEIGAKRNKPSEVNNQTVSTLIIYDTLLSE
ncbi:FIST C-terminal domain-containing protein [Candidatus Peregrinibacteria bacterium]|nr:FIST C-terminal domain-containing protein [Candidatus Peregrinibacteria bacterium]